MTEYAAQGLPPALPLEEAHYLARIAASLERIADSLDRRAGPAQVEPDRPRRHTTTKVSERRVTAREFVEDMLKLLGPQPWRTIVEKGRHYGHSEKTMERERHHVAVARKVNGHWLWYLK